MTQPTPTDDELLTGVRDGDEEAFRRLVDRYNGSLIRLARCFVKPPTSAEGVAQETWLGFLQGLERFEGRSSLRTWLFGILTNKARNKARKDSRYVAFSALANDESTSDDPSMPAGLFQGPDGKEPGHWGSEIPRRWEGNPERELMTRQALECALTAIDGLPPAQRAVLLLRDVQGFDSEEACNVLDVGATHQRVLLHRARSKVRRALDEHSAI